MIEKVDGKLFIKLSTIILLTPNLFWMASMRHIGHKYKAKENNILVEKNICKKTTNTLLGLDIYPLIVCIVDPTC